MDTDHTPKEKFETEVKRLEKVGHDVTDRLNNFRNSAFSRFPIVFTLLSSFGLVATFYGFEKVIDQVPYFTENPHMILVMGIIVLLGTGALYKKLN